VASKARIKLNGLALLIYSDHKKDREQPNYITETGKNDGDCDDADSGAAAAADDKGIKIVLNRQSWLQNP
jgi:hypothetical protein